jgi:hypothetical protein
MLKKEEAPVEEEPEPPEAEVDPALLLCALALTGNAAKAVPLIFSSL